MPEPEKPTTNSNTRGPHARTHAIINLSTRAPVCECVRAGCAARSGVCVSVFYFYTYTSSSNSLPISRPTRQALVHARTNTLAHIHYLCGCLGRRRRCRVAVRHDGHTAHTEPMYSTLAYISKTRASSTRTRRTRSECTHVTTTTTRYANNRLPAARCGLKWDHKLYR